MLPTSWLSLCDGTSDGHIGMFRNLFIATVGLALLKAAQTPVASASDPQWALMAEGTDYSYYVDSGNITDLPNRSLRFRTLVDLTVPDVVGGEVSYSAVSEWLMDCNTETIMLIGVTTYDDHCAGGLTLATEPHHASEPRPVVPQSAFSVALAMLCLPQASGDEDIVDFARESWLASRPPGACSD